MLVFNNGLLWVYQQIFHRDFCSTNVSREGEHSDLDEEDVVVVE
jgi:hypothetical protein